MGLNWYRGEGEGEAVEAPAPPIWRSSAERHEAAATPEPPTATAPETPAAAVKARAIDPFDPLALEERLREARARRSAALANRDAPADAEAPPPPRPAPPAVKPRVVHLHTAAPPPEPAAPPELEARPRPEPLVAPPRPPRRAQPRRARRWLLPLLFTAGLALGAAGMVAAPADLRERTAGFVEAFIAAPEAVPAVAPLAETAQVAAPEPAPVAPSETTPVAPSEPVRIIQAEPAETVPAQPPDFPEVRAMSPTAPAVPSGGALLLSDLSALSSRSAAPDTTPPAPALDDAPTPDARPPATAHAVPPEVESPAPIAAVAADDGATTPTPEPVAVEPAPELAAPGPELAAVPEPPVAVAPGPEPAAVATAPEPPVAVTSGRRVFLHVPPSVGADTTARAVAALREAGFAEVSAIPVRMSISRTNVRFYHDRDGSAAQRVAAVLNASLDIEAPQARDFTSFSPPPLPGTLEVWLAGQVPAQTAPQPAAAATPATRIAPTASQQRARDTAAAAEIQRLVEQSVATRTVVQPRRAPPPAHPFARLGAEIDRAVNRLATGQ